MRYRHEQRISIVALLASPAIRVARCDSKVRYYTRSDAKHARQQMRRYGHQVDNLDIYRCPHADPELPHWHLGHPSGTTKDYRPAARHHRHHQKELQHR